jgi:hypothetical protein
MPDWLAKGTAWVCCAFPFVVAIFSVWFLVLLFRRR